MPNHKINNLNIQKPANALITRPGKLRFYLTLALLFMGIAIYSTNAISQDNAPDSEQSAEEVQTAKQLADILSFMKDDGFVYRREGRPDPFVPFITEQMLKAEKNKENKDLTELQLLEPGQLSLVAIIFSNHNGTAMVQDSQGKGYILNIGTKIGRTGIIEDIVPNTVIIKQTYKTISGKTRYRNIEMVLKKEGEK